MAEISGIALSAASIASLFTTCVDCFGYIQLYRHFGRDYHTSVTTLNLLWLRLSRWGESVNLYDDPDLCNQPFTDSQRAVVKHTLQQIQALFEDSRKISRKCRPYPQTGDPSLSDRDTGDLQLEELNEKMRRVVITRQQRSRFRKVASLTSWSLYRSKEFTKLIDGIRGLLDELEQLIPAQERRAQLAEDEMVQLSDKASVEWLERLERLAAGVDELLHSRAADMMAAGRHSYGIARIEGDAMVHDGDFVDPSWDASRGVLRGSGHKYGSTHSVVDAIIKLATTRANDFHFCHPTGEAIRYAYENTRVGSPLRRLLVDLFTSRADPDSIAREDPSPKNIPHAFLFDLALMLLEMWDPETRYDLSPSKYYI